MKLPKLDELLEYKNPAVLKLYEQNYPNSQLTAQQALAETLKYLWLTVKHQFDIKSNPNDNCLPPRCVMLRSMQEIDNMWHEFILFTQEYTNFCLRYFGEYLHHLPNIFDNAPISPEETENEISLLLPYIYDTLGENTVRVWFASYLLS